MEYDFYELAKKYLDDSISDLKEIVKIPSVLDEEHATEECPFGIENKKCLDKMIEIGERLGFKSYNCDNYAGHLTFGKGKESLGILGHLDVVPAVGKWTNDPFDPTIRDGKIYARGVLDDKGGVIASLYAMKMLKDLGFDPKKEIRLIFGCDEESGSRCLEHYFDKFEKPTMAYSPDADYPVIYGEKGILSFDVIGSINNSEVISIDAGLRYNIVIDHAVLEVKHAEISYLEAFKAKNPNVKAEIIGNCYHFYGVAAHAMQPEEGVNAAVIMFNFMNEYYPCDAASFITKYFDTTGKKLNCDIYDEEMKYLTINLGIAKYDGKSLKLGYNLRVPTDEHVEVIKKSFEQCLEAYKSLKLDEFHYSPRHFVSKDSFLVSSLIKAYQEITGDYESKPFTIGGGTYARMMENAVAFGPTLPGHPDICHQPDEHIYVEDLVKWIAINANAIYLLTK